MAQGSEVTGLAGVEDPPRGPAVKFGNPAPLQQYTFLNDDGEPYQVALPARHLNQTVTDVDFAGYVTDKAFNDHSLSTDNDPILTMIARVLGAEHRDYAVAVNEFFQIQAGHIAGGQKPTWVWSDDPALAAAIAAFYKIPVSADPKGPVALLTNGGRDNLHSAGYNTATQPAAANYMALTANATAPAATDTTLTAEIATASGGLIRKQASYAHTAGTNTTTLTATFTANGFDVLPVTIAKIGIFNAVTVGTMVHETLLNATATLTISGDSVTITDTITLG